MHLIRPIVFALVLAMHPAGLLANPQPTGSPALLFPIQSFDEAVARAGTEGKVLLIDFYTTWCAPCKMLDRVTWQDPVVIQLLQAKAVSLKIDAEQEKDLASRYRIEAYPTLLLLKPDGTEIDRLVGYREPARFVKDFAAALAGRNSVARAQEAIAHAVTPKDMVDARYALGKSLAQQGQDTEALAEFLWCYDEGVAHNPSFAGVRSSFLLGDIRNLGQRFPPARAALVERRDAALAGLLAGGDDPRLVHDLHHLNRVLQEEERTLALFDQLADDDPRRRLLGPFLLDQLRASRRYGEDSSFQPFAQTLEKAAALSAPLPSETSLPPEVRASMRTVNVQWFAGQVEVLAGAGELAHARELLAKARSYDGSPAAETIYREALARAGQPALLSEPAK